MVRLTDVSKATQPVRHRARTQTQTLPGRREGQAAPERSRRTRQRTGEGRPAMPLAWNRPRSHQGEAGGRVRSRGPASPGGPATHPPPPRSCRWQGGRGCEGRESSPAECIRPWLCLPPPWHRWCEASVGPAVKGAGRGGPDTGPGSDSSGLRGSRPPVTGPSPPRLLQPHLHQIVGLHIQFSLAPFFQILHFI